MVMENSLGNLEMCIVAIMRLIREKDMVKCIGMMALATLENGKMEIKMVKVNWYWLMDELEKEILRTVNL